MKPYVICHMMATLDGRIDPVAIELFTDSLIFEEMHPRLDTDAWLCGRVTLQRNFGKFAETETFRNDGHDPVAGADVHVALGKHRSFAIAADSDGKIMWKGNSIDGDHIVVVTTEKASKRYLSILRDRSISYIVVGSTEIDFVSAFSTLKKRFGIKRLALEGGGHVNGSILQADLVDELSLLLLPGIDGRKGISCAFDGLPERPSRATPAKLKSMEKLENDVLWLRYDLKGEKHGDQ